MQIQHPTITLLMEMNIYKTLMPLELKPLQTHNHTTSIMFGELN